ncbi:MAG: chorismate synthase [Firmicutes bacterium]|nr:chorismate synthase [Bacillota bacterium]
MGSVFGKHITYSIFGQAYSDYIGIVIDGLPAGEYINPYDVKEFLARRTPGKAVGFGNVGGRKEEVQVLSGLKDDTTCGTPLCAVVENEEYRPTLEQRKQEGLLRPSEADLALWLKGGDAADLRGGGHYGERVMAVLCYGGAVAKKILEKKGIAVGAHIETIGNVQDKPFDPVGVTADDVKDPGRFSFPSLNFGVGETMQAQIDLMEKKGDSIGGVIEGGIVGLPAGLGDPLFDSLKSLLAANLFALPSVDGVEFGDGFRGASMKGSVHNDEICLENGAIRTKTNHCGGILCGVSTGMPVVLRVAVRPSPTIPWEQNTVNVNTMEEATVSIEDHVPCLVPQMVPVVESILAMTVLDLVIK